MPIPSCFRGVEDALLALEHTVIAVLHQQAQHGGAQHPGQHLHLPLFGRQLLAGVESIFQQVAQHHAEVGLRMASWRGSSSRQSTGTPRLWASWS